MIGCGNCIHWILLRGEVGGHKDGPRIEYGVGECRGAPPQILSEGRVAYPLISSRHEPCGLYRSRDNSIPLSELA